MPLSRIVYVVDDDPSVRRALTRLLLECGYDVAAFGSGETFMACAQFDRPCCVVLDAHMPGLDGFAVHALLQRLRHDVPVIYISGQGSIAMGVRAMKQGAVDFLTKPVSRHELLPAIAQGLARSENWHGERAQHSAARDRYARLTPREREVLALVLAGKRNKQIASVLGSQEATVKVHRSRLMRKLETRSLAELVRLGQQLDEPAAPLAERDAPAPRTAPSRPAATSAAAQPRMAWT